MTPDQKDEQTKRTTIRLPEWLYDAVSSEADKHRRSLNQQIIVALCDHMAPREQNLELENKNRNQSFAFIAGTLLALSTSPPPIGDFTPKQVEEVLDGLVEFFRSHYRGEQLDPKAEDD
ncbi:MAG: hypothetical protein MRY81_10090 [Donghicola eburneus]|nr:hypothetical protein [Donghicola eburneus]MCI5040022.1 hypothetical protein [Donghicola eburneus]